MPSSLFSKIIALGSFALGAWTFVETQAVAKGMFEPIQPACMSRQYATMDDFVKETGYQPFDQRVGFVLMDPFVCLLTQFLHQLVAESHPAGLIAWGLTALSFPAFVTMYLEAGRQGSKGLLVWPTLLWFLFQVFGVSVIFPALWVPSYCLWGNSSKGGAVSLLRARLVFWISLAMPILTVLVFCVFPSDSEQWTTSAGLLGGPMICLPGLLLAMDSAPFIVTKEDAIKSAETAALSYGMTGVLALMGYFYIAYTALMYYGLEYELLLKDVWYEANPAVKFMTIDAVVFWMGLVLHIGSRDLRRMIEAIVCTPFFGPGAACAMALASIEMDSAPEWTPEEKEKKET